MKKVGKSKGGRLIKMGKVKVGKGRRLKRWESKSGKRWEIEKVGK